jgi:hypothetical protein
MDLQAKILELEAQVKNLTERDFIREEMLVDASKNIDLLYKNIDLLFKANRSDDDRFIKQTDALWGWVENFKSSDKYLREENDSRHEMIVTMCTEINVIRERLSTVFYKVFPEAELADEALERVVQAERAERKNKPNE